MLFAFAYSVLRLLLDIFDVRLRVRDPEAELLLLRHQLRVVRRQVKRPQLDMADRTIMAALSRRLGRASLVGMLVQPEAVIGSHRELVRRKWAAFSRRRGPVGASQGARAAPLGAGADHALDQRRQPAPAADERPANSKSSFGTAPPLFVTQSHSGSGQLSDDRRK